MTGLVKNLFVLVGRSKTALLHPEKGLRSVFVGKRNQTDRRTLDHDDSQVLVRVVLRQLLLLGR